MTPLIGSYGSGAQLSPCTRRTENVCAGVSPQVVGETDRAFAIPARSRLMAIARIMSFLNTWAPTDIAPAIATLPMRLRRFLEVWVPIPGHEFIPTRGRSVTCDFGNDVSNV